MRNVNVFFVNTLINKNNNMCITITMKFIQDRKGTIRKIAEFLGRSLTEKDIDHVMEHTSLENMKNNPACNFSYVEEEQKVDKTHGTFINTGNLACMALRVYCNFVCDNYIL